MMMLGMVWRRAAGAALVIAATAGALGGTAASAVTAAAPRGTAAVPWKSVGPGWVLAQAAAGRGKTTLFLASPAGRTYALPASDDPGFLVAWSGDKSRALFELDSASKLEQVNLQTGRASRIQIAGADSVLGYTLPAGRDILAVTDHGSTATLGAYSQSGRLVTALATGDESVFGIEAPNGASLAVSAPHGLRLVSSSGRALRNLPVPGAAPALGCSPVRWWTPATVLADCYTASGKLFYSHLYLVPASGARPAEPTPARTASYDLGDIDAWQLPSGLYVQSEGACGTLEINRQAGNSGGVTPVTVPGANAPSYAVLTAAGPRLLVETLGCAGGGQLLWLNPATRAETWLFKGGVSAVVPFASPADGTI